MKFCNEFLAYYFMFRTALPQERINLSLGLLLLPWKEAEYYGIAVGTGFMTIRIQTYKYWASGGLCAIIVASVSLVAVLSKLSIMYFLLWTCLKFIASRILKRIYRADRCWGHITERGADCVAWGYIVLILAVQKRRFQLSDALRYYSRKTWQTLNCRHSH